MWFNNCTSIVGQKVVSNVDYAFLSNTDGPRVKVIPYTEIAMKVFFYLIVFLIDIVGNSVVIFTIYVNKRMRTSANILIANLAVSDVLVGCFCMWVHLGNQISHNWPFGSFLCKFETFVQVIAVVSSVVTLTSLSIERFFAVMFPLKGTLSKNMLAFLVAFSWIAAIGTSAPNIKVRQKLEIQWRNRRDIWCDEIWPRFYTDTKCTSDQPGRRAYYVFLSVFMYFIPVVIMLVAYGVIGIKLCHRRIPGYEVDTNNEAHCNAKRKVLRMFFIVMTAFIVCWTPQQGLILYMVYRNEGLKVPSFLKDLQYAALFIAYSNSAINPIIYAGMSEKFRKGFQDALHIWCRRNRVQPVTNDKKQSTVVEMSTKEGKQYSNKKDTLYCKENVT
ncbi:QRFP-like peptide receptor [Saccostrea echinata]|uniref:QRFP-like peptide receptor n=1 Tax=Saccostrea echinata TaxID=191078 RepID=UPI002A841928|nr:QRFP-like peptide receptor [Saccostrea echinata]